MKADWIKWIVKGLRAYLGMVDTYQQKKKEVALGKTLKDSENAVKTMEKIEEIKEKTIKAMDERKDNVQRKSTEYSLKMSEIMSDSSSEASKAQDIKRILDGLI